MPNESHENDAAAIGSPENPDYHEGDPETRAPGPWPFNLLQSGRKAWQAGRSIPYRGTVAHGVPQDAGSGSPTPGEQHASVIIATSHEPEPQAPVPVHIVSETAPTNVRRMFGTTDFVCGMQGDTTATPVKPIVGLRMNRVKITVKAASDNVAGHVIFIGPSDMNCNFPLFPGETSPEIETTEAIYAYAVGYAKGYIIFEYEVEVDETVIAHDGRKHHSR